MRFAFIFIFLFFLGTIIYQFTGDPQVDPKIEKAAIEGNVAAQMKVANFYLSNKNGKKVDLVKAKTWMEKAANQGNSDAQYKLSGIYLLLALEATLDRKIEKIKIDRYRDLHLMWTGIAAAQGHKSAMQFHADFIKKSSNSEIEKVNLMIREWQAAHPKK